MPAPVFERFGNAHLAALTCTLVAAAALVALGRRARPGTLPWLRHSLAAAQLACMLVEPVVAARGGWLDWQLLPLHLCDVSALLSIVTLATLSQRSFGPLYFFALAGTLPALLTPEIAGGYPSFAFFIYFLPHGLTVVVVLFLTFGLGLRPSPGVWWRTLVWLNTLALLAGLANAKLGTNFLYLARKPEGSTPFDWFGPWPWYILTLEAVCAVVFYLLDRPWRTGSHARPEWRRAS